MRKTLTIVIIPFLVLSFTCLISCKDRVSTKQLKNKAEEEQVKTLEKEIERNVYPLPIPAEVMKMLTELDVGSIIEKSNPVENAKKYYTSASRAINLGVFGADLSYATLYNIKQQVIDYMDAIRVLADELNMAKIYNAALYDTITMNYDNRDLLVKILTNAFNETYAYLSNNDQQNMALLVVGGAWVEGMYLTTLASEAAYQVAGIVSEAYDPVTIISKVLLEQKKSFELYLDLTKPYLNDPMMSDFIKNLEPIIRVYEGLGTRLTHDNINDITKAISSIKEKIII